ncbi:MAG: ABC transporter permease subunit [Treponema sp.]|nr:ABC transporter permease subunit [Treponema sp.]
MKNLLSKIAALILSIICFLGVWALVSKKLNSPLILPSVKSVLKEIYLLLSGQSHFWNNFLISFGRIILSFILSSFLGSLFALFAGYFPFCRDFLKFPISFLRTIPVISIILIALFWLKSSSLPLFVSVLMTFPVMYSAILSGFLKNDDSLMQMASVYKLSRWQIFRYIQLPHTIPFFINGLISTFGLSWKVVAAGEVLSVPEYGIGSLLQLNQIHLESSRVFAITLIFAVFSFITERVLAFLLKLFFKDKLYSGPEFE